MPVLQARRAVEDIVEVVLLHLPATPVERIANRGAVCDDERVAIDFCRVDVDHVVAHRVIERGADDLGAARNLRIRRRVNLDLVDLPFGVSHAEARLHSGALPARDFPAGHIDAFRAIGPSSNRLGAHRIAADAIGKPARIGNFVDRVDVQRTNVPQLRRDAPAC